MHFKKTSLLILCSLVQGSSDTWAINQVRVETRTDAAVAAHGVSGAGVTVAILDRGVDWRHPDFIKPDGTTRIKWILDMSGQTWCADGNPAAQEFNEAQINAALSGGPPINTRDAVGHGSLSASVAAGNGRAFAGGKYRGMAPEADLIIVKITSDGAPAHDGEPAETFFVGCVDDALDWLDAKIDLLGQPAVAFINMGTQFGPMDGTAAVSRKIDQVFGLDRPGRVYVTASGDEGMLPNHAGKDYDNGSEAVISMTRSTTASAPITLWYTEGQPAEISVAFDDGTIVGPVGPGEFLDQSGIFIIHHLPGSQFYPWTSTSGDGSAWINIAGHQTDGELRIRGLKPGSGHLDVYGDILGPNFSPVNSFTSDLVPGRLADFATTLSASVVGSYVLRTNYVDIDDIPRTAGDEGSTNELWQHSSGGPTRDGRRGVDITTPGHNLFGAIGPSSYWATFRFNMIQDGGGWYSRWGATSAAAPIAVGAVALMLEINPDLTAREVRDILRATSRSDGFTGAVPNDDWGFGKLDVLAALNRVAAGVVFADGFEEGGVR